MLGPQGYLLNGTFRDSVHLVGRDWKIYDPESELERPYIAKLDRQKNLEWSFIFGADDRIFDVDIKRISENRYFTKIVLFGNTCTFNDQSYSFPDTMDAQLRKVLFLEIDSNGIVQDIIPFAGQEATYETSAIARLRDSATQFLIGLEGDTYFFAGNNYTTTGKAKSKIILLERGPMGGVTVLEELQSEAPIYPQHPESVGYLFYFEIARLGEDSISSLLNAQLSYDDPRQSCNLWLSFDNRRNELTEVFVTSGLLQTRDWSVFPNGDLLVSAQLSRDTVVLGNTVLSNEGGFRSPGPLFFRVNVQRKELMWHHYDDAQGNQVSPTNGVILPNNRAALAMHYNEDLEFGNQQLRSGGARSASVMVFNDTTGALVEQYVAQSDSSPFALFGYSARSLINDGNDLWVTGNFNYIGTIQGDSFPRASPNDAFAWHVCRDITVSEPQRQLQHHVENDLLQLRVAPNPGTGSFSVFMPSHLKMKPNSMARIFSPEGRQMDAFEIPDERSSIPFQFQKPGVYLIQVEDQHGRRHTGRFVVR